MKTILCTMLYTFMLVASFGQSEHQFRRSTITMTVELDSNQTIHNSKNYSYIWGGESFSFEFDAIHGDITCSGGIIHYTQDGKFICRGNGLIKIFIYDANNQLSETFVFIINPKTEELHKPIK